MDLHKCRTSNRDSSVKLTNAYSVEYSVKEDNWIMFLVLQIFVFLQQTRSLSPSVSERYQLVVKRLYFNLALVIHTIITCQLCYNRAVYLEMKFVILRLHPLQNITEKCLLPHRL